MNSHCFTIGYQGRRLDDLCGTLFNMGVEVLVDIRERAWSQRPEFRKRAFRLWLNEAESSSGFGADLDSLLGLRTDAEQEEYEAHWATVRNKCAAWAILIAIASLLISILVHLRSGD